MLIPWRVTLAAKFITEAMNHHSIKPARCRPMVHGQQRSWWRNWWLWDQMPGTQGNTLGIDWGWMDILDYFVKCLVILSLTTISKMLDMDLILEKLWKKWKSKMESFYQISSFHIFQRSRLEMVPTLGLYWFWAMPWHQRWSATWRSWPRQVDGATGFCFLCIYIYIILYKYITMFFHRLYQFIMVFVIVLTSGSGEAGDTRLLRWGDPSWNAMRHLLWIPPFCSLYKIFCRLWMIFASMRQNRRRWPIDRMMVSFMSQSDEDVFFV